MPSDLVRLPRYTFGVELETQAGDVTNLNGFVRKHDTSVQGWEYASPILKGKAGLAKLRNFMRRGRGMQVDSDCGLHVHIGVENFSNRQLHAVYAAYLATEDIWFRLVPPSRQDNHYCYACASSMLDEVLDGSHYGDDFKRYASNADRYNWINCASLDEHGTFENRLHHGTWNYEKVACWVALNLYFIRFARHIRIPFREERRSVISDYWDYYWNDRDAPAADQDVVDQLKRRATAALRKAARNLRHSMNTSPRRRVITQTILEPRRQRRRAFRKTV